MRILMFILLGFVTASAQSNFQIYLEWDNPQGSIVSNKVMWGDAPGHYTNFMIQAASNKAVISSLNRDVKYYFCVRDIFSNNLESPNSNEVSYLSQDSTLSWNVTPDLSMPYISFNIRTWRTGQMTNQMLWPVRTNISSAAIPLESDPEYMEAVSWTNSLTGSEGTLGISQVTQIFKHPSK